MHAMWTSCRRCVYNGANWHFCVSTNWMNFERADGVVCLWWINLLDFVYAVYNCDGWMCIRTHARTHTYARNRLCFLIHVHRNLAEVPSRRLHYKHWCRLEWDDRMSGDSVETIDTSQTYNFIRFRMKMKRQRMPEQSIYIYIKRCACIYTFTYNFHSNLLVTQQSVAQEDCLVTYNIRNK